MVNLRSSRPTVVILADDLLASWLQENLSEEHYQVLCICDDDVLDAHWSTLPLDLIIGEVRYPVAVRLQHIEQLWAVCPSPRPAVLLLGTSAPPLQRFAGQARWLPAPFHLDILLHLVQSMLDHCHTPKLPSMPERLASEPHP